LVGDGTNKIVVSQNQTREIEQQGYVGWDGAKEIVVIEVDRSEVRECGGA
jgi:hypothetical protein